MMWNAGRRRAAAVGGCTTTAVLSGLIGVASNTWQVGALRAAAWSARGLRVPARNALLADVVPAGAYGRDAYQDGDDGWIIASVPRCPGR